MSEVTLREYMDKQLDHMQRAVTKAEEQLTKRLEGMNEFRDTLKDQAARLATREALDDLRTAMDTRIKNLELNKANNEGKNMVFSVVISVIVSIVVGLSISFIGNVR